MDGVRHRSRPGHRGIRFERHADREPPTPHRGAAGHGQRRPSPGRESSRSRCKGHGARPPGREPFEELLARDILSTPCDIFAPCAAGGVLRADTIEGLRCKVIWAPPTILWAPPKDALRLHEAKILYIPDIIANAGATILGASTSLGEEEKIPERKQRLAELCQEILSCAQAQNRPPLEVVVDLADQRIRRPGIPPPKPSDERDNTETPTSTMRP